MSAETQITTAGTIRDYVPAIGLLGIDETMARISEGWCPLMAHGRLSADSVCQECPDVESQFRYDVTGVRWQVRGNLVVSEVVRTILRPSRG